MSEWHEIPRLLRQTKTDVSVWATSFALTVFADLTVAVEVGMMLAALLYIRRASNTTTVSRVTRSHVEEGRARPAGQTHTGLRDHPSHSRPVSVRRDGQTAARRRQAR